MNTKKILQIVGLVVLFSIIVFGIIYALNVLRDRRAKTNPETTEGGGLEIEVSVPETGEKPENESIAVPVSVADAATGVTDSHLRTFLISAEDGKFTPSVIIVYKNDTVHINFTAIDGEYDITVPDYGLQQITQQGETKPLEFRAEKEGEFAYYCELCGGPSSGVGGKIIVKAQSEDL